jgi:hypothetical protein
MFERKVSGRTVDALLVTGAEHTDRDSEIFGVGAQVRASGAKTCIVRYRAGGELRAQADAGHSQNRR